MNKDEILKQFSEILVVLRAEGFSIVRFEGDGCSSMLPPLKMDNKYKLGYYSDDLEELGGLRIQFDCEKSGAHEAEYIKKAGRIIKEIFETYKWKISWGGECRSTMFATPTA